MRHQQRKGYEAGMRREPMNLNATESWKRGWHMAQYDLDLEE